MRDTLREGFSWPVDTSLELKGMCKRAGLKKRQSDQASYGPTLSPAPLLTEQLDPANVCVL